jgi:DNA (cytosine-5)-methyltransferase 1
VNVLDLFSGIGGFSLGLERAGMRTVGFCEIDPYCRAVLRKHWPDVPIFEDIRSIDADRLARLGRIDVIAGGFPCQPFSVAGIRKGKQDDRNLWPEMFRVVSLARPAWVIAENVAGLITLALDDVLTDMEGIGYASRTLVIPAAGVGAPHRRDRLWVIATDANREHLRHDEQRQAQRWHDIQDTGQTESANDGDERDAADATLLLWPEIERNESDGAIRGGQAVADANGRGLEGERQSESVGLECTHGRLADGLCEIRELDDTTATIASNAEHSRCQGRNAQGEGPETVVSSSADVADADSNARPERRTGHEPKGEGRRDAGGSGERPDDVADASGTRPSIPESEQLRGARRRKEGRTATQCDWWTTEPPVGRMAHGIPRRVDRLRCLGNAVVPQIPQIIGEAIMMEEHMR